MLISLFYDNVLLIFGVGTRYLETIWKVCSKVGKLVEISFSPHTVLLWVNAKCGV